MYDDEQTRDAQARVGTTVGKYHLDALLGVGGTAAVFAGTHRNGNRVAVKILHAHYAATELMRARFLREGYVANKVDHPGTVRVIDDDTADDATFLVMELLDGETLEARAERAGGRLPVPDVAHHGSALLEVLDRAHAAGIVHRDLKPENVFLTTAGQLKILDFGIARLRDASSTTKTQTGMMMGTPAFLAPEQALGRTEEVDARTDLWAVGATLFTLLTARHVHLAQTGQEAMVYAATQAAPPIRSIISGVPEGLARVIDRALRFRREERFSSAAEMRAALDALRIGQLTMAIGRASSVAATGGGTMMSATGASRPAASPPIALAIAIGAVVAIAGIAGGLVFLRHRHAPPVTATSAIPVPEAAPMPEPSVSEAQPAAAPIPVLPIVVDAGPPTAKTVPTPAPIAKPKATKDPFDPR